MNLERNLHLRAAVALMTPYCANLELMVASEFAFSGEVTSAVLTAFVIITLQPILSTQAAPSRGSEFDVAPAARRDSCDGSPRAAAG